MDTPKSQALNQTSKRHLRIREPPEMHATARNHEVVKALALKSTPKRVKR